VRSSNSGGQSISIDTILKTSAAATPIVTGVGHTNLTNTSAKISATINANGNATSSIRVLYGTTTAYTDSIATSPASASGTTNTAVSVTLPGLVKNTLYNYQVKAVNSAGTTTSSNITFTTTNIASIANIISKEFGLYPNPSTDFLYISADIKDIKEIAAVTLSGKIIYLDAQKLASDHHKVSTKTLSAGIYYIRVRTNEGWIENSKAVKIE
jgi:phosphodiesterase/alkaline phosphatase D-like protein